jgi:hypothetical protein
MLLAGQQQWAIRNTGVIDVSQQLETDVALVNMGVGC